METLEHNEFPIYTITFWGSLAQTEHYPGEWIICRNL